jgi:putative FmdB family regulatory protein
VPIYEYACKECGHRLDALQKMNDDPLVDCPECGEPQLQRQLSAPRFRLKGKGWYETDFKKDNQRNVHKSDAEPTKSSTTDSKKGKSGSTKTDKKATSKSAGKTDSK